MAKRHRSCERHQPRVHARVGDSWFRLPPESGDSRFIVGQNQHGFDLRVRSCHGLVVFRGVCTAEEASKIHAELDSNEASSLSWTALRDGGNPDSLLDTMKCYCGEKDQMLARGGRYRQQLLVRGRRADPMLAQPTLSAIRKRVFNLAVNVICECAGDFDRPLSENVADTQLPSVNLLTEQLIKYLPSDRWFAPHWDKDRRDKSSEPLNPKAYDGPGDAITTLCTGCPCTLLMLPRQGDATPFALELEPGDVYVLAGESRWEWRHGISVSESETIARRVVVWRWLVD